MAGPWEDYQTTETQAPQKKPWEDFQVEYAESKQPMTAGESLTAEVPPMVGAVAGGLAKTAKGRTLATGVLAGGGEALHQIYQHATEPSQLSGREFEEGKLQNLPQAPQTSTEAAERIGITAAEYALPQAAYDVLFRLFPKVEPHFIAKGIKDAENELAAHSEQYQKQVGVKPGLGFTIGQKVDPLSGAARMEDIIKHSFFGATPLKKFEWAQEQGLRDYAKRTLDYFWGTSRGLSREQQGKFFAQAYDESVNKFSKDASQMFNELDNVAKQEMKAKRPVPDTVVGDATGKLVPAMEETDKVIDLRPIKKSANAEWEKIKIAKELGSTEMGNKAINATASIPDFVNFEQAKNTRTRLRLARENSQLNSNERRLTAQYENMIDSQMEKSAKELSPATYTAWRKANDFYKKGMETFHNEFIDTLAKTAKDQPELVGKHLFQSGEITQIKRVKGVLKNDLKTWQALKAGYIESVFDAAAKPVSGTETAVQGRTMWRKFSESGMGEDAMKEILTPQEFNTLKTFEKAALTAQTKPAGGGGSLLIQLIQAGPLVGAVTLRPVMSLFSDKVKGDMKYHELATGIAVLASPVVLGKMMINPKYQQLFINGLSRKTTTSVPAITKLAQGAYKIYSDMTQGETKKQED